MNQQQKSENEYIQQRRLNLEALREAGVDPFPVKFSYDITPSEIKEVFEKYTGQELEEMDKQVKCCGRILSKRIQDSAVYTRRQGRKTGLQTAEKD